LGASLAQPVTRVRASNTIDAVNGIKTRDTFGGANKQFKATDEHPVKKIRKGKGRGLYPSLIVFQLYSQQGGHAINSERPPGSATHHHPGTCRTPHIPQGHGREGEADDH
jgi:hypothetical protein